MGHFHSGNLSRFIVRYIYAKGKVSIQEGAEHCQNKIDSTKTKSQRSKAERDFGFFASEGMRSDIGDLKNGLELVIRHHYNNKILEPVFRNDYEEFLFEDWEDNGVGEMYDDAVQRFDNIQWKFASGGRRKYIDKKVTYINEIEL